MPQPGMAPGMVIVGAGEAGARAASALRENGWAGPITLIGDELHPPYERPPLSKAVMVSDEDPLATTILSDERLKEHDIELLCGCAAVAIDRAAREVVLADGRRVPYARLLLATGSGARRLAAKGAGPENVLYLRKFTEALALRSRLRPGGHLVVIGGGFIGLEIAASARARGCEVTLIELGPRLLTRGVPPQIAEAVAQRHRAAGVTLVLGARLAGIESDGDEHAVVLEDGGRIACDGIVAGIGAVPETALAEASGLAVENGVRADATLRTSDPDIFSAGDCCSFPHPLFGGRRIRLEAWRNAQDQGTLAARNMLGADEPYTTVPWFWSDQYDLSLQIAGLPDEGPDVVARDLGEGATMYFHRTTEGRLVGASAIGPISKVAREVRVSEMLIARRASPDPALLADPTAKLKAMLLD
jgi:3-phenylpropionate/trans-cinnamate dioxygenase ferredoxin reductase subunit